ncbi:MAG: phosphoribosyltransferase regulatory subunit [Pseudomonadota bacterium]|jgi:ATP phosphoribosyltransferase regulatory subunit
MNRWLLPENIADVLPSEARKIEELRRILLDRFQSYGYELVMPPMLEYLDSLLTGAGQDLNLKTFKLVDQLSGRTLGLRADITPQVARIDAHLLNRQGVTRLCYAGSVLHTLAAPGSMSREQLQLGAEIYGYAGWEADLEVQKLLNEVLNLSKVGTVTLDMSHAGLLTAILGDYQPESDALNGLYAALQTKDLPGLNALLASWPVKIKESILALVALSGSPEPVLKTARQSLPNLPGVLNALNDLERLCQAISSLSNAPQLNLDLSDLRGYQYHSGVMFAAYVAGLPAAVARGGRYDMVGAAFGRSRPATGFSLDIMTLSRLSKIDSRKSAILAPWSNDSKLSEQIAELRHQGEVVIQLLPGHEQDGDEFHCDRELLDQKGAWVVKTRA